MKKSALETFIKKYNLNGSVESVRWLVDDVNKILSTSSFTDDRNLLVNVSLADFSDLNKMECGIFDTAKLKQMISVLGDDITIKTNGDQTKLTSLSIKDDNAEIQYVVADLSVIPAAPTTKKLPDFNVEIDFSGTFITKFIRAKNALDKIPTFTLSMNKKNKLEMTIGETKNNSNRIKFDVVTKDGKDTVARPMNFNANYLKEILNGNSECDNATLRASDFGLANITFIKNNFTANYYLFEIKNVV